MICYMKVSCSICCRNCLPFSIDCLQILSLALLSYGLSVTEGDIIMLSHPTTHPGLFSNSSMSLLDIRSGCLLACKNLIDNQVCCRLREVSGWRSLPGFVILFLCFCLSFVTVKAFFVNAFLLQQFYRLIWKR